MAKTKKRTKAVVMQELAEAQMERDHLEYMVIEPLKKELMKFRLTSQEKDDLEIYD